MADQPHVRPPDPMAGLDPQDLMQLGLESPDAGPPRDSPAAHFVPPEPAELAECFPELEILECIGRGGMGCVYKARQKHLDRLVALKILLPELGDDPAFAERFTREARTLARLVHPNIVTIHDFGQACGLSYLVMEYVDGLNLRERLQADGLSPAESLAILPELCDALQYAHDEGVVHRDIKPENILFDRRGHVKLADFGLVKLVAAAGGEAALTQSRQAMGTPYYMAPEQWKAPQGVDHRADIYALGVVFYEMLTGQLPLGRFDPPSHKAAVDSRLDEIILRAMQGDPHSRYQRADEMGQDVAYIARTANDPLRIVPQLPRRMRTLLPGLVEAALVPLRPIAAWLKSLGEWLRAFVREFPFPTVAACGFVMAVTVLPWVVASEVRTITRDTPTGRVIETQLDEREYEGQDTWTSIAGLRVENYWPAVAAGVIIFLALFRKRLGLRSEMLSACLCLYGMAHVYCIYESRVYGAYQYTPLTDARLTAAPLVVGVTFAVLLVGSCFSMGWRVWMSVKGQRTIGSVCRSFGRLLMSECREV